MEYGGVIENISTGYRFDPVIIEKALRISEVLAQISGSRALSNLVFKGGSALNYIYMKDAMRRLSIDLDFNAVGEKGEVFRDRDAQKEEIRGMCRGMGYEIDEKHKYGQSTFRLYYTNIAGVNDHVKIEISFIDRVTVIPTVMNSFSFPFVNHDIMVRTYTLEELASEKLRAAYTRTKGRDIFDLYHISFLGCKKDLLRKLLIYKLTRARVAFNPKRYFENISQIDKRAYERDLLGFVVPEAYVDFEVAISRVLKEYAFLGKLAEKEKIFIDMFRHLMGEDIPKSMREKIESGGELTEHPLSFLFSGIDITELAQSVSSADLFPNEEE